MVADDFAEEPLCFTPPNGVEWPEISAWGVREWTHWLLEHNRYPYLKHWTPAEVTQYLQVDRYKYGFGLQRHKSEGKTWFYLPAPIAVPFHASKVPNILFGGAAGGTKSHSARWDCYRHLFGLPNFRAILMRRTLEELARNHWDHCISESHQINNFFGEEIMQPIVGRHELRVEAHGKGNGSKAIFGHCQNVGDEEKYLGDAYEGFYPDEMATFEKKQITGVSGRLRTSRRGFVPFRRGTSNPGGGHTLWMKDYHIDKNVDKIREENPRYKPEAHEFLGAMLYDNPYYMDPDGTYTTYEDRLFDYDPERRRQLLMGDWNALSGQFFPEFSLTRHVKELSIPPGCKIEMWLDWGYDPHYGMAGFVAVFPNGRLYLFYEWKFNGAHAKQKMVASEVAKKIKQYTLEDVLPMAKSKRITKRIADPSMWSGDGHSGEDYAQTFARCGVPLTKADNERVMGWGRLRHWFQLAPDGLPWLVISPRCAVTARTIPALVRDKHDPDDVDTTGEDHPADMLRYGVMARPTPTKLRESVIITLDGTPASIMRGLTRAQGRPMGMVN